MTSMGDDHKELLNDDDHDHNSRLDNAGIPDSCLLASVYLEA